MISNKYLVLDLEGCSRDQKIKLLDAAKVSVPVARVDKVNYLWYRCGGFKDKFDYGVNKGFLKSPMRDIELINIINLTRHDVELYKIVYGVDISKIVDIVEEM